jgi:hypothetical protein
LVRTGCAGIGVSSAFERAGPRRAGGNIMTLCPIAVVAGCRKCPAFAICPLKSVIGDQPKNDEKAAKNGAPASRKRSK